MADSRPAASRSLWLHPPHDGNTAEIDQWCQWVQQKHPSYSPLPPPPRSTFAASVIPPMYATYPKGEIVTAAKLFCGLGCAGAAVGTALQ